MKAEVLMRMLLPAILGLTLLAPPASAEMCTLDPVPAATLLLPYFEVDLDAAPGAGVDTVFTVHNALPAPTIAHVALWTDWSQPVIDFDVFLTGYDVETISLYQALALGNLPVTADEQSDQGPNPDLRAGRSLSTCVAGVADSCSPHGSHPSWDGSFEGTGIPVDGVTDCDDIFPFFINPLLTGIRLESIQDKLTGRPADGDFDGDPDGCFGADHGDNVARGYVTIDNADACSLIFPYDPGYFSDGVTPGLANNVNQLWGDWSLVDPQNLWTLPVDPLVHVEADDAFDASSTATGQTFYGRYTGGAGGIDNREPLASAWAFSYRNAGPDVTDLVVWRDSTADDQSTNMGYPCGSGPGSGPDWQPLGQTQIACFDQAENAVEICGDADCLALESQRLELGAGELEVPFAAGWCFLNLNLPGDVISREPPVPPEVAQSWVGATVRGGGTVTGGFAAVALAHACQDASLLLDGLPTPIFGDGFESGGTSAWSVTEP